MHIFKTLSSAVVLILSTNAAPLKIQEQTGWRGPGLYQIVNRAGGTAVDLYNGGSQVGTPIYGWTPDRGIDHQIWLIARMKDGDYAMLNHETSSAIGATGATKPVIGKAINPSDPSIRWTMITQGGGSVIFESVMYPGNVLDLSYGSPLNKTPITSYPRHNGLTQQWRLDPLDETAVSEYLDLTINKDL